jgi:hypothetical protein
MRFRIAQALIAFINANHRKSGLKGIIAKVMVRLWYELDEYRWG